jgi:hypothetical protein
MNGYTITKPGMWRNIYTNPNVRKFREPTVEGVDFPTVRPRQAYWDATEKALYVSITSCDKGKLGEPTSFRVSNLLPGTRWRLSIDGVHTDGVEPKGGTITVDTKVGAHAIVVQQLGA